MGSDRSETGKIAGKLRDTGFRNISIFETETAKEQVRKHSVDLIFYCVEKIDDLVLRNIKEISNLILEIPLVVAGSELEPKNMRKAIKAGAYDFLVRPFHLEAIPVVITRNIERKKLLREQLRQKQSEVLMKAINSLITAMEAKDKNTSGHSMRVVKYAIMMGERLGLSEGEMFILQLSATLHDIGKIGMPDNILKKASSLQEMEYVLVKEHPLTGSRIVGRIDELKEVAAIIKHHHERFDGSGYPDGLKGEVIPLISRILAIVDAFEAIISDRVYRKGLTPKDAIDELKKHSGTQFDPYLLKLFVEEIEKQAIFTEVGSET